MAGIDPSPSRSIGFPDALMRHWLERGILALPSGRDGRTCSLLPAYTVHEPQLRLALDAIVGR